MRADILRLKAAPEVIQGRLCHSTAQPHPQFSHGPRENLESILGTCDRTNL